MKKSKLSTTIGLKFGGGCEVDSRTKHWVDGSAVDYESWHSNQPDNWKCNENCGAVLVGSHRPPSMYSHRHVEPLLVEPPPLNSIVEPPSC
ncbi:hypothetical protein NECAME_08334 [Necator americanus]|uniref:C-type lectin domain-containing protein n=1 Tax=Necator americanus TaxID=51031 RepID=W2TIN6_NECAM|nr:hypothetical protein NECAME_08334 [Necator americanus]ETN81668.1 hypothetical protein NECAME_08334 [Necator americanus]